MSYLKIGLLVMVLVPTIIILLFCLFDKLRNKWERCPVCYKITSGKYFSEYPRGEYCLGGWRFEFCCKKCHNTWEKHYARLMMFL